MQVRSTGGNTVLHNFGNIFPQYKSFLPKQKNSQPHISNHVLQVYSNPSAILDISILEDKHFVVLDDKPKLRELHEEIIKDRCASIKTAGSVGEGLEIINGLLEQKINERDIFVVTDYQFKGKETAIELIKALRPSDKERILCNILIVSGSMISENEIIGFDGKDINNYVKEAYGIDYLEKNINVGFKTQLLSKLCYMVLNPFEADRLSNEPIKAKEPEEMPVPQGIGYFDGGINDFEVCAGMGIDRLLEHVEESNLEDEGRNKIINCLDEARKLLKFRDEEYKNNIEMLLKEKKDTGETLRERMRRLHDYKNDLWLILTDYAPKIMEIIERNDAKSVNIKKDLKKFEGAIKLAYDYIEFLRNLFFNMQCLIKLDAFEPLLQNAIVDYQLKHTNKTDKKFDKNEGISRALENLSISNDDMKKGEIEEAMLAWGRLFNDYKAIKLYFDTALAGQFNKSSLGFISSFSDMLNRFFGEYVKQFGHYNLKNVKKGGIVGRIRILKGSEKEILKKIDKLTSDDIAVIWQDYSELARVQAKAGAFIFAKEGASHITTKTLALNIPVISFPNADKYLEHLDGQWIVMEGKGKNAAIRFAAVEEVKSRKILKRSPIIAEPTPVIIDKEHLLFAKGEMDHLDLDGLIAIVGTKGARQYWLGKDNPYAVKKSTWAPYSLYDALLDKNNIKDKIKNLYNKIEVSNPESIKENLSKIRELVVNMKFSDSQKQLIKKYIDGMGLKETDKVIIRLSTSDQDLDKFPGVAAGIYRSKGNIPANDINMIFDEMLKNYESYWTYEAFCEREMFNIDHFAVGQANLIQEYSGTYSARICTVDTESQDPYIGMIEITLGAGGGLSGTDDRLQGDSLRIYFDKIHERIIDEFDPRKQFHPVMPTKRNYVSFDSGEIIPIKEGDFDIDDAFSFAERCMFYLLKIEKEDGPNEIEMVFNTMPDEDSSDSYLYIVQNRALSGIDRNIYLNKESKINNIREGSIAILRKFVSNHNKEKISDLRFYENNIYEKIATKRNFEASVVMGQPGIILSELWEPHLENLNLDNLTPFLRALFDELEFSDVREGLVRRIFNYVSQYHIDFIHYLNNLYRYDKSLFFKVIPYVVPHSKVLIEHKNFGSDYTVMFEPNGYLMGRFINSSGKEMISEIVEKLPMDNLIDLINQIFANSEIRKDRFVQIYKLAFNRPDKKEIIEKLEPMIKKSIPRRALKIKEKNALTFLQWVKSLFK